MGTGKRTVPMPAELKQAWEQAKEPSPCLHNRIKTGMGTGKRTVPMPAPPLSGVIIVAPSILISGNPRNQRLLIEIGLVFA